jgi:hypothetical protein
MAVSNRATKTHPIIIRLTGRQPGVSLENLIFALERLYPQRSREMIRTSLQKLPLLLTRSATKQQAAQIKSFLEARGGILKLSYQRPVEELQTAKMDADRIPTKNRQMASESYSSLRKNESSHLGPAGEAHMQSANKSRPIGIVEVLSRSFHLLRSYFKPLFVIMLFPQILLFMMNEAIQCAFLRGAAPRQGNALGIVFLTSVCFSILVFLFIQIWAQGALTHAVSRVYSGQQVSVLNSYRTVRKKLRDLISAMLFAGLLVVMPPASGVTVLLSLIPYLKATGTIRIVMVFLVVLIAVTTGVLFLHFLMNFLMLDKVVILENLKGRKALRRSKQLMNAHGITGFLNTTKMKAGLILIATFFVFFVICALTQIPGLLFAVDLSGFMAGTFLEALNTLAATLAILFGVVALIVYYYDIRCGV